LEEPPSGWSAPAGRAYGRSSGGGTHSSVSTHPVGAIVITVVTIFVIPTTMFDRGRRRVGGFGH
jgi:hypothetical protein